MGRAWPGDAQSLPQNCPLRHTGVKARFLDPILAALYYAKQGAVRMGRAVALPPSPLRESNSGR